MACSWIFFLIHSATLCLLIGEFTPFKWASLVAQLLKNLPARQEIPVQFLGQEDPFEKG